MPDYAANMRVTIVNENGEVMATDIFETDHARLDFTFANDEDRAVYVQALSRQRLSSCSATNPTRPWTRKVRFPHSCPR